jgi:predicted DNA-binding WGR domain protein
MFEDHNKNFYLKLHKDIFYNPEKYLSDEAISEYNRSKEEEAFTSTSIWIVYGYINEHGDTDTWVEELFDDEAQAKACCEFLNLTKTQKNVEYSISENAGFNNEDWIAKLRYLNKEA